MKDEAMIAFYKGLGSLDPAEAWAAWQQWCQDNDEQPGSLPEFVGRLRRTHEAQLRQRCGRGKGCRVGVGKGHG